VERRNLIKTANIGKLGASAKFEVSTLNKHIKNLTSLWFGKPILPIFANRCATLNE